MECDNSKGKFRAIACLLIIHIDFTPCWAYSFIYCSLLYYLNFIEKQISEKCEHWWMQAFIPILLSLFETILGYVLCLAH